MEKIERLAKLNPKTEQVSWLSLEMFRVLRGFAMLDWTLKHPNDLGQKKSEAKFAGLMEKTWELMAEVQLGVEGGTLLPVGCHVEDYFKVREADIDPEGETTNG